jgi:hypothetical protein
MDHRRLVTRSVLLALALFVLGVPAARSQDGGRTVSDGTRSLSASQTEALDPSGQVVSVSGAGYPEDKGIYVALCAIPAAGQRPSPCGGGRGDATTGTGASLWIGTYPPGSGKESATPYGPGGTFSGTLAVAPEIAPGVDCRQVRCAIVTRADHTRTSDRSLDLFLPVTFASAPPATSTPTTAPPPAPTVTTTIPPLQPTQVAPVAAVAADGRSVSDGVRSLRAEVVEDLDPTGTKVLVSGRGFDVAKGVYVALCAVPQPDADLPPGAAAPPGPCAAGDPATSRWISSNPPAYGADLAVPYGEGGSFEAELVLRAEIDADHDCRRVACALATRHDDANAADRTQDLLLPVTFAASAPAAPAAGADRATPQTALAADEGANGGGGGVPLAIGLGAAAAAGGGALVLRRRSRHRRAASAAAGPAGTP